MKGKCRGLKETFKDSVNKIANRTGKETCKEEKEIATTRLKSLIPFAGPVFYISFISAFSRTLENALIFSLFNDVFINVLFNAVFF